MSLTIQVLNGLKENSHNQADLYEAAAKEINELESVEEIVEKIESFKNDGSTALAIAEHFYINNGWHFETYENDILIILTTPYCIIIFQFEDYEIFRKVSL